MPTQIQHCAVHNTARKVHSLYGQAGYLRTSLSHDVGHNTGNRAGVSAPAAQGSASKSVVLIDRETAKG